MMSVGSTVGSSNNSGNNDTGRRGRGNAIHPFWRFLYLLGAPITGWKKLKKAGYVPEYYARNLFYPLLALMAVSQFVPALYGDMDSLSATLQDAISVFVAGFASYYAVVALGRSFLPSKARMKIEEPFGRVYVMTCLGALTFAYTVFSVIPGIVMLFIVAPIYVEYLIVKGIRFLRVPAYEENTSAVILTLLIMVIPTAIYFFLKFLMPSAEV